MMVGTSRPTMSSPPVPPDASLPAPVPASTPEATAAGPAETTASVPARRQRPTPITGRDIIDLARSGALPADRIDRALRVTGLAPDTEGLIAAVQRLMPALAVLAAIGGGICVVAANWQDIGRFARFGAALAILTGLAIAVLAIGLERPLGRSLLTVAIGLIGPALALYGQTYQTGADVHTLMFTWVLLALPWMVASRQPMAWMLVLAILQGGGVLWLMARDAWLWLPTARPVPTWLMAAAFQAAVLLAWEVAASRMAWLSSRWPQRILAWMLMAVLTVPACLFVLSLGARLPGAALAVPLWLATLAVIGWHYGKRRPDTVILSGLLLAVATFISLVIGRATSSFVLVGMVLLVAAAAGTIGIRHVSSKP